MLTDKDIDMIHSWRKELETKRLQEVVMQSITSTRDRLTGELIEERNDHLVQAILTERSSRTASELITFEGAEIREGDLWFSVSIEELNRIEMYSTELLDSLEYVVDKDREYRITSWDRKGIGRVNRVEFLAKVEN